MGKSGIVLMKRTSIMTKVDEIQIKVQKYLSKEYQVIDGCGNSGPF
jgi:hypothetical protein